MFWSLFSKQHRFSKLAAKAKKASADKALGLLIAVGLALSITPSQAAEADSTIKTILAFDKVHADKFGTLIVQDSGGRMKPMDTLTTEILAKIHGSSSL